MTIEERVAKLEDLYYRQNLIDKTVFARPVVFNDDISTDKTAGIKIGKTTDKMGFYGVTPVDKPATVSDPSGGGAAGVDTPARTAINSIIDRLQELGLIS